MFIGDYMEDSEKSLKEKIYLKYTKYYEDFFHNNPIPLDIPQDNLEEQLSLSVDDCS